MDKRSQTLEALSAYIEAQSTIFARTQTDLARLISLRDKQRALPHVEEDLLHELNVTPLGQAIDTEGSSQIKSNIEWTLYTSRNAAPLRALALSPPAHLKPPPPEQPSELQRLVRSFKTTFVDPVFNELGLTYNPPPPSPRPTPATIPKRKLDGSAATYRRGVIPAGAFVRRDVEDESAEVDIGGEDLSAETSSPVSTLLGQSTTAPSAVIGIDAEMMPPPPAPMIRIRNPSRKGSIAATPISRARPKRVRQGSSSTSPEPATASANKKSDNHDNTTELTNVIAKDKHPKPKSETYKQPWSVEEQHMLERLLEEYPDGAKNRWLQISRAMGGRRTPRQVASRVQKYFEKLKRFGLDVDGGTEG